MLQNTDYTIGDIVEMHKTHPCGSRTWKIIRIGADIKLKCNGCGHIIMLPRVKFNRSAKQIIK